MTRLRLFGVTAATLLAMASLSTAARAADMTLGPIRLIPTDDVAMSALTGFHPSSAITVSFDGVPQPMTPAPVTDAAGKYAPRLSFPIPTDAAAGRHDLLVADAT